MWFKREEKTPLTSYLSLFLLVLLVSGLAYHILSMSFFGASRIEEVLTIAVAIALGAVVSELWRRRQ